MEKLIELLNEYEIWKGKNGLDIRQQYSEHNFKYNKWLYNIVISKKYGFIKWLVDNDKIDRKKAHEKIKELGKNYGWFDIYSGIVENCLLMLLSISDTPIDDLISYLK